jgi:mannose-1-phosphate guanylyltransferase
VIPARGLGWDDVGSWNALYDVLHKDEDGNSINCEEHVKIDTRNTMVHQNGGIERMIVTIGVENLVIVDTGDVLMVCEKAQAQAVRDVVNTLKKMGKTAYL